MQRTFYVLAATALLALTACGPATIDTSSLATPGQLIQGASAPLAGYTPRPGGLHELTLDDVPDLSGTWTGEVMFLVTFQEGPATLSLHRVGNHYEGTLAYEVTHNSRGIPDFAGTFNVREAIIVQNHDREPTLVALLEARGRHSDWVADENLYFGTFEIRSRTVGTNQLLLARGGLLRTNEQLQNIDRGGELPEARLTFSFWN